MLAASSSAAERSRKQAKREEGKARTRTEWNYSSPAEILMDIQASVPQYKAVSYAALQGSQAGQWGRQNNENYYFDGTSYENTGGLGVQTPSGAESGVATLQPFKAVGRVDHAERPFTLVGAPFLYDDGALMTDANLLDNRRAKAQVAINPADADALGVRNGDQVTLSSGRGSLALPVYRTRQVPAGVLAVPLGVKGAALIDLAEGAWTAVSLRRAEA